MDQVMVRLLCPECTKHWERPPDNLPDNGSTFQCPECDVERSIAEFMRTGRDLETLKQFG